MRRLYLLRHAKSSWDDPSLADRDRSLAPRGRKATKLLAGYLRGEQISPELVICSSARRARETLEGIASTLHDSTTVLIEDELYGASERDLMARVQAIPDTVGSAILIGHNPAIQSLAIDLASGGEDTAGIEGKYPTGALATLTFDGPWGALEQHTATLAGFVRPRDLG